MQPGTSSAEPRSPLNCSSHRSSRHQESLPVGRRATFRQIVKTIRLDNAVLQRSPSEARRNGHSREVKVPMAPKPELQISDDNILFANRKRLSKSTQVWLNNAEDVHWGRLGNRPDQGSTFHQGDSTSPSNFMRRTSTPFLWRHNNRRSVDERLNSALVGAPRLSLNAAMETSSNDFDDLGQSINREQMPSSSQESVSIGGQSGSDVEIDAFQKSPKISCGAVEAVGESMTFPLTQKTKRLSEANDNQFRCRICLEEGDMEGILLSPCRCKGTVGLVHHHCLRRWVLQSGKPQCELCGYVFILTPSRRGSGASPTTQRTNYFRDWLAYQFSQRHLIIDIVCLILLTPSTILATHFCVLGALSLSEEEPGGWQASALWALAMLLILLLAVWTILAVRHHVSSYQEYRQYQTRRNCDETARQTALPFRRFSIQARPRGSSIMMTCSTPSSGLLTERNSTTTATRNRTDCPSVSEGTNSPALTRPPSSSASRSQTQITGVQADKIVDSGLSTGATTPASPRLHVSFALSALPEVTEEQSGLRGPHASSATYV